MSSIVITLPDGSKRTFEAGVTAGDIANSIGKRLGEDAIAAKVDGKEYDLFRPIEKDAHVAIITRSSPEGLEVLRHSTAHLLAQAIKELYPKSQITIGPVIEDGFYYDVDFPDTFTPDDLPALEKRMTEIAARKLSVARKVLERNAAIETFKKMDEHYKAEIIRDLPAGEEISAYQQGDFLDLCRGPHVPNTAKLGKFKLLSVAGAYWRGDEKNKMLTRIYGTAFATQKELDEHLNRLEEAKKRDHRKLGPELGLFQFLPYAPAMPFYLAKGAKLVNLLMDFMRKEMEPDYQEVICPQIMNADLWRTSGHLENYRENMFLIGEEEETLVGVKPMNCPGHCALYASTKHSYKELPLRMSEFTKLHRNERAGVTHGLLRTRAFCQDDAHIFCTPEQVESESLRLIQLVYKVYKLFGFTEIDVKLATRPEKSMGSEENWQRATDALANSLKKANVPFSYLPGEGAFYGPKIEFHIRDSLKRYWQCGTIQLDFNFPERFDLNYIDSDNQPKRPFMIHRAVLGSVERFMGILIEHHAGHFPLWISPVQAVVINVSADQEAYAKEIHAKLLEWGVRAEIDLRYEKLGYKIREAQLQRTPLMLVLGAKEVQNRTLSVRKTTGENINDLTLDAFRQFLDEQLKGA